jgi:hypothetical protein
MTSIKESKPKILNTLDYVIANLQADETVKSSEWQAVMIAREVLVGCSMQQLANAVERVSKKLSETGV